MADETIRRLERKLAEDEHDADARLALGTALLRSGKQPQDNEIAAYAWIRAKGIEGDRVRMAARLGYGPAEVAWGNSVKKLDWAIWEDRKTAISILGHREVVFLVADFAEAVLPVFETQHPDDKRPRRTIEVARIWARDPVEENRKAARAARIVAYSAAIVSRGRARDAAWAAWSAAAAAAADDDISWAFAASDAAYAAKADDAQRLLCIHYLLKFPNVPELA